MSCTKLSREGLCTDPSHLIEPREGWNSFLVFGFQQTCTICRPNINRRKNYCELRPLHCTGPASVQFCRPSWCFLFIDIWISVLIIFFPIQITEKYSTAMCQHWCIEYLGKFIQINLVSALSCWEICWKVLVRNWKCFQFPTILKWQPTLCREKGDTPESDSDRRTEDR